MVSMNMWVRLWGSTSSGTALLSIQCLIKTFIPIGYQNCEQINKIPTFDSCNANLKQQRKEKGMLRTSFSGSYFNNNNVLALSHTANHTPINGNLDINSDANNLIFDANEPQAPANLAFLQSTLESLEEKKYDRLWQLIVYTNVFDPSLDFMKAAMDFCTAKTHRYIDYARLSYHTNSMQNMYHGASP